MQRRARLAVFSLCLIAASLLLSALAFFDETPAMALEGKCATCDIKTKTPSKDKPGLFEFQMACAYDITSEEKFFIVIAKDEDEARKKSQTEAPGDCW